MSSARTAANPGDLDDVKRLPIAKKGKGKKEYPARMTAGEPENPNPICVRDFDATDGDDEEADKINYQGMFRKVRNLTNGTLSNTQYEGFFTIHEGPQWDSDKEWFTVTLVEHPSIISYAELDKKFTILKNWRSDDLPHPPFWWPAAEGPVLEVIGCSQS